MLDSDVAVIEYWEEDSGEWKELAYIGPDRDGGLIEEYYEGGSTFHGCHLRIRYLKIEE